MILKASKQLENVVLNTLMKARVTPCFYKVTAVFSQADGDWSYTPEYVTGFNIIQDYITSYLDDISVGLELHPLPMLEILKHYQDLKCTLILTPHSWRTFLPNEEQVEVFHYRAIIENPEDLMKQYSLDQYQPTKERGLDHRHMEIKIPLRIQLLNESAYQCRHMKVNTVFGPNTTVEQAVHWVLNAFKIEQADVVPPSNKQSFRNMNIPPAHGLDSVFGYMQNQYGIYDKGLGFYYQDDKFHMWKAYDTEVQSETTLHIYMSPKGGMFDGIECYHYVDPESGDVHIVTVHEVQIQNRMEHGVENEGNAQVSVQADRVVDHFGNVSADGKLKIGNNTTVLNPGKDKSAANGALNMNFQGTTSNPYISTSKVAAYQGVQFTCTWASASPAKLYPGQKVIIHYDDKDGVYTNQKGILCGAGYRMARTNGMSHPQPFYVFQAAITAFLEPEPESAV